MAVADVGGLDAPGDELHQVAAAQVHRQRAPHPAQVARLDPLQVILARAADTDLHVLQRRLPRTALGEDEPQVFVGGLGPAVVAHRALLHVGRYHVPRAVQDQRLVVVGGVVGTDHHHPPHAFLARRPVHVVGHLHVRELGAEPGFALRGDRVRVDRERAARPGRSLRVIGRVHEGGVHHRVRPREVLAVGVPVLLRQVRGYDAVDRVPPAVLAAYVQQRQIVAAAQTGQHQAGDVAGGTSDHHPPRRGARGAGLVAHAAHGYGTTTTRPSMRPACNSANTSFTSASGRRAMGGGSTRPSRRSSINSARSCGVPRWEPRSDSSL